MGGVAAAAPSESDRLRKANTNAAAPKPATTAPAIIQVRAREPLRDVCPKLLCVPPGGELTAAPTGMASWQGLTLAALEAQGWERPAALRVLTQRYAEHMMAGEPVHTWPLG